MSKLTKERFREIMTGEYFYSEEYNKCNVFAGLKIITKYLPNRGVESASHAVVYSVDIDDLVEAGITESDAIELCKLDWVIEHYCLACYV